MKGSQEPRIRVEPNFVVSDGPDAALLMDAYGYNLDPWQNTVVNCWLGKDSTEKYLTTSAGLALPRQNGKNVCIEAREFFGLVILAEKMLHTAHQVRTSKKSFRRLVRMFTDKRHPEIEALVKQIRYTNGEESIELENGGIIEFSARSRQAVRGFDGIDLVIYDEAQELTDDQVEAIMATLSASSTGNRQIIYAGTPPYPGCPGTVFSRRREVCIESPGKHDSWHEWSVDAKKIEDIDIKSTKLWYQTNPALGYRLSEEFTKEECRTMDPAGFARERLGWWAPTITTVADIALNVDFWKKCASDEMKPEGKTAYGIKFSPDGAEVALAGAVIPKQGKTRITLLKKQDTGKGLRWLSDWLNARYTKASCVVIDGKNGVDVLVDRMADIWKVKDSVIRPTAKIMIAAVSMLIDSVNEQTVSWYDKQEELNDSAITSIKRPISGGFGFGGENSTPIEACALALWGVNTSKRNPNRKMRIG